MFVFAPPAQAVIPLRDDPQILFPVRRIYGVALNFGPAGQVPDRSALAPALYFMKPADSVVPIAPGETLELPYPRTGNLFHEIELCALIGKGGADIAQEDALDHVWGWCAGIDFTRKSLQLAAKKAGAPWASGKAFDQSCPVTPCIRRDELPDHAATDLWLDIDGKPVQRGNTREMLRTTAMLIEEISKLWTLAPGDVIMTGTPDSPGPLERGQILTAGVAGVGELTIHSI